MDFQLIWDNPKAFETWIEHMQDVARFKCKNPDASVSDMIERFYYNNSLRTSPRQTRYACKQTTAESLIQEGARIGQQILKDNDAVEIRKNFESLFYLAVESLYPKSTD